MTETGATLQGFVFDTVDARFTDPLVPPAATGIIEVAVSPDSRFVAASERLERRSSSEHTSASTVFMAMTVAVALMAASGLGGRTLLLVTF